MSSSSGQWNKPLMTRSNLESFLAHTTPTLSSQVLVKNCSRDLNIGRQPLKETIEYFNLSDFWHCYYEASAYGIGVPIVMSNGESIVQHYVPYLSAIQIYTNRPLVLYSEIGQQSRSSSNNLSRGKDGVSPIDDKLGFLYFQYFEMAPPHVRLPFMDKVKELAQSHPSLATFKSFDLSPASWMSVAWYPIYHIPAGKKAKGLSTAFLTYHSLSLSPQDTILKVDEKKKGVDVESSVKRKNSKGEVSKKISLPPFGLASYKMHKDLWMNPHTTDQERIATLFNVADSWLKRLRVQHNDFNFFRSQY